MRLLTLKTILVATDLTETSAAAIATAARLADAAGATLHVAHVAPDPSESNPASGRASEYESAFDRALAVLKTPTLPQTHLLSGEPPSAVAMLADRLAADVVVLGRRRDERRSASDRPVGSTAYSFVTQTLVPVLVVCEPLSLPMQRALVAIDASEAARGSLLVALSWSSALRPPVSTSATLTVLHVDTGAPSSEGSAHMQRTAAHDAEVLERNAAGWAGVTLERLTVTNPDPAEAISQQAAASQAELVILGTRSSAEHGQSIWGSTSAAVTRRSTIPILLVPPAVWRSHVRDIDPF
jgi:nucleotide-binding universal stress UspA family protein